MGSLFVPPFLSNQPNSTLVQSIVGALNNEHGAQIESAILSVTLLNSQGSSITHLDTPLTICLVSSSNNSKDNLCLSYYDEQESRWKCEDECLTTTGKEDSLCGQTGHLTNFALLLSGREERMNVCGSISQDRSLSWISLGFVLFAILVVMASSLVIEARIRWRNYKKKLLIGTLVRVIVSSKTNTADVDTILIKNGIEMEERFHNRHSGPLF